MTAKRSLTVARRTRATSWIVASMAILAIAAFSSSRALAQSITVSPPLATNIAGASATHTVTVHVDGVTGHCAENGACIGGANDTLFCKANSDCPGGTCSADGSPSDDGSFLDTPHACTSDTDCSDGAGDDFCSFTGFTTGVQVTGTNPNDSGTGLLTDAKGDVTYTYTDVNGVGTDSIQACLDLDDSVETTAECLGEVGGDPDDFGSNTATKLWVPKVMLSPATALNPINATHTVTAQVAGVCAESGGLPNDDDGEGSPCVNDSQCLALDSGGADEFCDFSGVNGQTIFIGVVGGTNLGAAGTTTQTTVNSSGQATFQYSSTVPGVDTIQGCLDSDFGPDENGSTVLDFLNNCISDGPGEGDFPSNQVTKHWFGPPTVTLTPASSTNPTSTVSTTSSHTVTATVTGGKLGTCTAGTNLGAACDVATVATDCAGASPVCDVSGFTIEFGIASGPNLGDKGAATTNVNGAASKTYNDAVGGAGLDTIQSCLDVDVVSGDGGSETAADCIAESGSDATDVKSNTVVKRWEGAPTVMLFNEDLGATLVAQAINPAAPPVFTKSDAFNPVGIMHTVEVVITGGKLGICTNAGPKFALGCDVATAATDCASGISTAKCDASGFPVGFTVLPGGQNPGDFAPTTWVNTDMNGVAIDSYADTNGAGKDIIEACLDADASGTNDENAGVASCIADAATPEFGDYATNEVTKYWLSKFVTGGGKVTPTAKTWNTFGGVVGQKPGSTTAVVGNWQEVAHPAKGGNMQCHWSAFSAFALSCTAGNCGTTPDTVVFTTAGGSAACGNETVKIVDGGKKPDKIQIIGSSNSAMNFSPLQLVSGNFTIHK